MFFQDLRTVSFDVPPQEVIFRLNTDIDTIELIKYRFKELFLLYKYVFSAPNLLILH